MSLPDPRAARVFRFVRRDWFPDEGRVDLVYAFDDGPELIERIRFPGQPPLRPGREAAFAAALDLMHWIAGVSYYKAGVPPAIVCEVRSPDPDTAELLELLYTEGLAEFAHQNGLDLRGRVRFPRGAALEGAAPALGLARRALVPVGGGKDSIVTLEALRAAGEPVLAAWVGDSSLIAEVVARSGLAGLRIERTLSPLLFELNRAGAWNGHIPVTAINSAILIAAAILADADEVVFSNERSASAPTVEADGRAVNHQWSKGWEFERRFGELIERHVAADLHYYSLLRPWSELAVTRRFARYETYDDVFSSCNRNFRILGERPESRWCGQCPKCHFVFLALAPFVPKLRLLSIFGRNLLDDPELAPGFDALIEWNAAKPFECVGEAVESRAAFVAIAARPEWREDELVARFRAEILPRLGAEVPRLDALLQPAGPHRIPARLLSFLDADR
jgi:hypothetical protein